MSRYQKKKKLKIKQYENYRFRIHDDTIMLPSIILFLTATSSDHYNWYGVRCIIEIYFITKNRDPFGYTISLLLLLSYMYAFNFL